VRGWAGRRSLGAGDFLHHLLRRKSPCLRAGHASRLNKLTLELGGPQLTGKDLKTLEQKMRQRD
jgi:hypothetical protein